MSKAKISNESEISAKIRLDGILYVIWSDGIVSKVCGDVIKAQSKRLTDLFKGDNSA